MNTPIGIFDSGSGGLSIWREISALLPGESLLYVGDHGNMPYSNKTTAFIRRRAVSIIEFLAQHNAKLIVVACNTATVAGIDIYRKKFPDVPIVGVVPVIKTATNVTKNGRIAVLSTRYTSESAYQKKLIRQFARDFEVISIGSTRLVSLIEKGNLDGIPIQKELARLLGPAVRKNVDVLALGCTHYPFVSDQIRAIVGKDVHIMDSGGAVARQVKRILENTSMEAKGTRPRHHFYTTGKGSHISGVMSQLLHRHLIATYVAI